MRFLMILSITTLSSFLAFAQVRTGGGGVLDPEQIGFIDNSDLSLSSPDERDTLIREYVYLLAKQEKACTSDDELYLGDNKEFDFYQAYLTLSFVKATKCELKIDYFKCLDTKELSKKLKKIKNTNGMAPHLIEIYKINTEQVKEILRFFKTLDKGCERVDCEM